MDERLLPVPNGDSWRETLVLCDMDSCESIPENPYELEEKFEYLIDRDGYTGQVSFWIVASEKNFPSGLVDRYAENGSILLVKEADTDAMIHKMFHRILFWALRVRKPGNLLIFSGNKNFGQDKFASIRQSMENAGFYVTVAPLESATKLEVPCVPTKCTCHRPPPIS